MKKLLLLLAFTLFSNEPTIRSIILVNSQDKLLSTTALKNSYGIEIIDIDLPSRNAVLIEELNPYLETPTTYTKENIRAIKETIYTYYREYDHPFVLVSVPTQVPDTGALQLIVTESRLGKVEVKGNHWTAASKYRNYFSTKPGQTLSQKQLVGDVNFMNQNPYRQVSVAYTPGDELYTTDLTLEVQDRKPYSFYAGFDNVGVPTTGRERVFAGFSWDQVFGLDHTFFYQYTTNYHVRTYHANAFQYRALLPWKALLNVYGGFAILSTDLPFMSQNQGTNIQASIRYTTPFTTNPFFTQEAIFGYDIKNTNNTIEFVDIAPVFGQTVNLTQFMLGYACRYEKDKLQITGGVEAYISPFSWLPHQTTADFQTLRPGATNRWFYAVGYIDMFYPLPYNCTFHFKTKVEGASNPLLPSEQLNLGGCDSVRGYDERQYSADVGFVSTIEFQTPRFPLFPTKKQNLYNRAYFLGFLDGGYGFDETAVPNIPRHNYLVGIGPGFRYHLGSYITTRVDYGFKLHRQSDFSGGRGQLHFSVAGSY